MTAEPLPQFTPSGQTTPSILHHFTPLAAQLLPLFKPSEQVPTKSYTTLPPFQLQS